MEEENCLNCKLLDKVNRCCSISEDKTPQKYYELEATWCTYFENILDKDVDK